MKPSGLIIGYDPGGNNHHGVAELQVEDGIATKLSTWTMGTAKDVVAFLESKPSLIALGVDTLTCWSTGVSGWRPADRWLMKNDRYKDVWHSIVSPNSLFGSMGLNGMAVLIEARRIHPDIRITETHPKVLYYHLTPGKKYDYQTDKDVMDAELKAWLGVPVCPDTEHAWDAAISAYAALEGMAGRWSIDLHDPLLHPSEKAERRITPCGNTHYFWPQ